MSSNLRDELKEEFDRHTIGELGTGGLACTCGWTSKDGRPTQVSEHLADVAVGVASDRLDGQVRRVVDKGFELLEDAVVTATEKWKARKGKK